MTSQNGSIDGKELAVTPNGVGRPDPEVPERLERAWRRQREEGILNALSPRRRGRPSSSPEQRELARLRQENERLSQRLVAAETVIEVQKKVALLLGLVEPSRPNDERS